MLLRLLMILVLFFPVAPLAAREDAPTTPPLRLAFVDVDVALRESRAVMAIMRDIDRDLAGREESLNAKKRELRLREMRLDQQGAVLSASERSRRYSSSTTRRCLRGTSGAASASGRSCS